MSPRRGRLRGGNRGREPAENTISLINIVFLLLIFFLVAGTLSAPRDTSVELANAETFAAAALDPRAIYVDAEGQILVGGIAMGAAEAVAAVDTVDDRDGALMVVPDRNLEAAILLNVLAKLRSSTERGVKLLVRRSVGSEAGR